MFFLLLARIFVTSLELLQSLGIFVLQNMEVDLYSHGYSKTCNFLAKKQGVDIHRFDLYTGKYGSSNYAIFPFRFNSCN